MTRQRKRRAVLLRLYALARREFLAEHDVCEVCWARPATEVHHRRGRGALLLDRSLWLAVDHDCHHEITTNPAWAYENGYSQRRVGAA